MQFEYLVYAVLCLSKYNFNEDSIFLLSKYLTKRLLAIFKVEMFAQKKHFLITKLAPLKCMADDICPSECCKGRLLSIISGAVNWLFMF